MDVKIGDVNTFLQQLAQESCADSYIRPDEFTIDDYILEMNKHGVEMNYGVARKQIAEMVSSGKLVVRRVKSGNRGGLNAYSEAKNE